MSCCRSVWQNRKFKTYRWSGWPLTFVFGLNTLDLYPVEAVIVGHNKISFFAVINHWDQNFPTIA
jgi:hypothetical protein